MKRKTTWGTRDTARNRRTKQNPLKSKSQKDDMYDILTECYKE